MSSVPAAPVSVVEAMFLANNAAMFGGFTVDFIVGGQVVEDVVANRGKGSLAIESAAGVQVQADSADFIVLARQLVINGQRVTPKQGNRVRFVENGQTKTFELMNPPFDTSDLAGTLLRLHAKFLSATP